MNTYRKRVDFFWKWFQANEEKIHNFIEFPQKYDSEESTIFIENALDLVFSKNAYFEFGGNYEFTFSTGGERFLFYLLPYLVARIPEDLKYKWTFSPYKMGGISPSFGYKKDDCVIAIKDIELLVGYDEKQNIFYVGFYNEDFAKIEEKTATQMFLVLLDSLVGESIVEIYVGPIERLTERKGKMIPMANLLAHMEKKIQEHKGRIFHNPSDVYSAYEADPIRNGNLREDLYAGTTCFFDLINEFYQKKRTIYDSFEACGSKACFLYYDCSKNNADTAFQIREEIIEKIEKYVLDEKDSGREIGILLGTGFGEKNAYIDLLLYDEEIFLQEIKPLLQGYDYQFYLADFCKNGEIKALSGKFSEILFMN
jgi:hypothetical protein